MKDNPTLENWLSVYTKQEHKAVKRIHNAMLLVSIAIPFIVILWHALARKWRYSTLIIMLLILLIFQYIVFKISWLYSLRSLKITQHGIRYRKESGAEGFIPWDNLIKIVGTRHYPDIGTPIYYFVYYKDKAKKKKDTLGAFNEECLYHIRKYLKERGDIRIPIEFIR